MLPAYGAGLKNARDRGQHPERVWVIYGNDWARRPDGAASVCVGEDYEPSRINWAVLAGLPAHVVWRSGERICEIVAEVAYYAAPVVVHFFGTGEWPREQGKAYQEPAEMFLYPARHWPEIATLWTDEREADYLAREAAWRQAMIEDALNRERRQTAA